MRNFSKTLLLIFFISSCSTPLKIIKFPRTNDEVYSNSNLKEFFKANPKPNIVLRVPNNNDQVTSKNLSSKDNKLLFDNNFLYNSIEKELVIQNFSVRDRALFNELLSKSKSTNYSNIKELTNTDLILEVLSIDRNVVYTTNKFIVKDKKGDYEKLSLTSFKQNGASVEFRIILVKNNEIAGSYKYKYPPCPNGCSINFFKSSGKLVLKEDIFENNELEPLIKLSIQDLVNSIK